jgi:hypothetical protein
MHDCITDGQSVIDNELWFHGAMVRRDVACHAARTGFAANGPAVGQWLISLESIYSFASYINMLVLEVDSN